MLLENKRGETLCQTEMVKDHVREVGFLVERKVDVRKGIVNKWENTPKSLILSLPPIPKY